MTPDTGSADVSHSSHSAVSLLGVAKRFGPVAAVTDVSLTVRRGEMFGVIGADGAGKTTVIRLICGLLHPDGGDVRVFGRDREAPLARFPMTRRLQRRLWRHIESVENFWETLEEIEAGSLGKLGMSRPLLKFGGGSVEILHDVGD